LLQSAAQARRRRRRSLALGTVPAALVGACGELVARNPSVAGGLTAFLIVVAYVSANALWYQPRVQRDVFLRTRPELVYQPAGRTSAPEKAPSDPGVARLQSALHDAGFYDGPVDGVKGPRTDQALADYRKANPAADAPPAPPASAPPHPSIAVPLPRPNADAAIDVKATTADIPESAGSALAPADIVRIQAGLKAFGNDAIHIDGVAGTETRNAIREFQSLFHLPVTGQADSALMTKMREVGLID